MRKPLRVTIVGAASITWMPTFFSDLSRCKALSGGEVVLSDIDAVRQETMYKFGEKLIREKGADIRLRVEPDLERALEGANFVVCNVLIGGHDLWTDEMNLILKHGISHPKGMSVGPGGIAMGIRQVPWIVELAHKMERICPDAWLLNFSNPMQLISYAVQKHTKIKFLGLCHGVTNTVARMAEKIGVPEEDLFYTIGGVNHFEIITKLQAKGKDLLPDVALAYETIQQTQGHSGEIVTAELYRLFGGFPCNEDIHVIEFLPYYIQKGTALEPFELIHNYIENRIVGRNAAWARVQDYVDGKCPLTDVVSEHSSEKIAEIIEGISANVPTFMYVNVLNDGFVDNLDRDMCVEVPVVLHREGYMGCHIGDLPRGFAALQNLHGAVQHYAVNAAMTGDFDELLRAMSLDPMCFTLTLEERKALLRDIIALSRDYLPDYWQK